nr:hypothetical protein [Tanacetum cinerariifolium]
MAIPKDMITDVIRISEYYQKYLDMAARKPRQATTVTDEEGGRKKKAPPGGKSKNLAPAKQHALAKQTKPVKEKTSKPTPSRKIHKGKVMKVYKGKRSDHLVDEEDEEPKPASEPQVEDDKFNLQRGIQMSLESFQALVGGVAIREPDSGRRTPVTQDASTGPSTQPPDDTSENVVCDTLSSTNVETGVDTEKSTKKICANFEKKNKLQDKTTQALLSKVYTLENHDMYLKIDKYVNESRKRRRDDQDPPPPPLKDSDQSKKKRYQNNQKKMMRETEVHKFSDGMLTIILKKLDFMVKDYELFKFNPGMEHRIWSEDNKQRIQDFIKHIERRLKIRVHSMKMHSPKATIEFRILQRQDVDDASSGEWSANQCEAFESNLDEAPTAQSMFMANLSSADPIYDEVGPSYDLDLLSEVQDHDNYLDSVDEYQEVHEIYNDVQQNYVVVSYVKYMSDSNIILYDKYVKNNTEQVVQSNVSSMPNDALMIIINDMHDQAVQCVSMNEHNKVVNESLTAKLVRYKEQVAINEKKGRFELTEREQKIDE